MLKAFMIKVAQINHLSPIL